MLSFKRIEENNRQYIVVTDEIAQLSKTLSKVMKIASPNSTTKNDKTEIERIEVPLGDNENVIGHIADLWFYERHNEVEQSEERISLYREILNWLNPGFKDQTDETLENNLRGYDSDSDNAPGSDDKVETEKSTDTEQDEYYKELIIRAGKTTFSALIKNHLLKTGKISTNDWTTILGKPSKDFLYPLAPFSGLSPVEKARAIRELKWIQDAHVLRLNPGTHKIEAVMKTEDEEEEARTIETEFLLPTYRGIHYLRDRSWSRPAREAHRTHSEIEQPYYSEAIIKTLDTDEQDAAYPEFYMNFHAMQPKLAEDQTQTRLAENAEKLRKQVVTNLRSSFPVVAKIGDNYKIFDNLLHFLNHIYSNGIDRYLKLLEALRKNYPDDFTQSIINKFNFLVSVAELPYHSIRYSLGNLKKPYDSFALHPYRVSRGRAFIPHVGKILTALHPLKELINETAPNNLRVLQHSREITLGMDIGPETEISFYVYIEAKRIFTQMSAKHPSFHREYKPSYLGKFGFDPEFYGLFCKAYKVSKQHPESNSFDKLLAEWLCRFHAAVLHQRTLDEIKNRKAVMIFRDPNLKFTVYTLPKRTTRGKEVSESKRKTDAKKVFKGAEESLKDVKNPQTQNGIKKYKIATGLVYDGAPLTFMLIEPKLFGKLLGSAEKRASFEAPGTPLSGERSARTSPGSSGESSIRSLSILSSSSSSSSATSSSGKAARTSHLFADANIQIMPFHLRELNLRIQKQPGDGNCLFHAIAAQINHSNQPKSTAAASTSSSSSSSTTDANIFDHVHMRKLAVAYMKEHFDEFKEFIPDFNPTIFSQRLDRMKKESVWGDFYEIYALAKHFNRPIVILHKDSRRNHVIFNENAPGAPVFLYYTFGSHYDALLPHADIDVMGIYKVVKEQRDEPGRLSTEIPDQKKINLQPCEGGVPDENDIALQHAIFMSLMISTKESTAEPKVTNKR